MKKLLVLLICGFSFLHARVVKEQYKSICVVTTSRNNADWYQKNLDSVFAQNYPRDKVHIVYCDDASTDNTFNLVWEHVVQCGWQNNVTLLGNNRRRGAMFNHWRAIHLCAPDSIIVNLDGDDWFAHNNVLQTINQAYQNEKTWITYGQYEEDHNPGKKIGHCREIPRVVKQRNAYRAFDWVSSHPRTFYAGLFQQIPLGYLLYKDDFFTSAVDLAMMFAMLELSGGRVAFIPEILYMYNVANPNLTCRKNVLWQLTMGYVSRGRQSLRPLTFNPMTKQKRTPHVLGILFADDVSAAQQSVYDITRMCDGVDEVVVINRQDRNIKMLLATLLDDQRYTHIMFFVHNKLPKYNYNITNAVEILDRTHAHAVYFDRYQCAQERCPFIVEVQPMVFAWKFRCAQGCLQKRYSFHNALYKRETLSDALEQVDGNTLRKIKKAWNLLPCNSQEDVGLLVSPTHNT